VRAILKAQDNLGRWVHRVPRREQVRDAQGRIGYKVDQDTLIPMMYSREFIANMTTLADYITAAQGGGTTSRDGH